MALGINWIFSIIFIFISHPLHMSFTNIEYSASKQKWEVSVKLFKDDFAVEINKLYDVLVDIEDEGENQVDAACFQQFISDHFMLIINKDTIDVDSWEFLGKKLNFEAIWLKFSFEFQGIPKNIEIKNTLMFGLFQDQKNLLIFKYKNEQKAYQFRKNKPQIHFVIE